MSSAISAGSEAAGGGKSSLGLEWHRPGRSSQGVALGWYEAAPLALLTCVASIAVP